MSSFSHVRGIAPRGLVSCVLGSAVLLGVGCESSGKVDSAAARQNSELRQRNATLEMGLRDKDAEIARLQGEVDSLQAQLSDARNAPAAAAPPSRVSGGTGFEGIDGVDSARNSRGEVTVDVAGDVLFDSGSTVLKSTARRTLDRVASVLESRYSSNSIRIAGHTDSDPIRKTAGKFRDNEELSAQRALAVERYLSTRGVSRDRMYSAAFGPSDPRGSKRESRRVEIVILAD